MTRWGIARGDPGPYDKGALRVERGFYTDELPDLGQLTLTLPRLNFLIHKMKTILVPVPHIQFI